MPARPVSKQQAAYLGAIVAGVAHNPHLSPAAAQTMLRGAHIKQLPKKVKHG